MALTRVLTTQGVENGGDLELWQSYVILSRLCF